MAPKINSVCGGGKGEGSKAVGSVGGEETDEVNTGNITGGRLFL